MSRIETFAYQYCPLIFGMVLIFSGIFATTNKPEFAHGIIMICSGLICVSFFGVSALLIKLIEKQK